MKNCIYILLLFFASGLSAQTWQASYDEALIEAKKQDKPMLLVFAGSDWCAPCIKLERTIWQSDAFRSHAASHLILYKA
ncbi:MAG: thioredoxin family protein, partial [Pricia sp.]